MERILQCMHDVCNKLGAILLSVKVMQKTCEKCPKRVLCGGCPNLPMLSNIIDSSNSITECINMQRQSIKNEIQRDQQLVDVSQQLQENGRLQFELSRLGKENQLNVTIDNRLADGTFISLGNINIESEGIQFLNNLFFNAKKANAVNIRLVCVDLDDHIAFRFIDDGDGMSADTIACLGLPIASKTSTGEGTNILKKIAIKSNGTIEWSSAGKGAGCCVTVRFTKCVKKVSWNEKDDV